MTYLFVAGKEFPHWNRRTGTHGNHCYQYTDRNQIDHFAVRSCSFSVQLLFVFIFRLNNSLLFGAPFFYFSSDTLFLFWTLFFVLTFDWVFFLSFSDSSQMELCSLAHNFEMFIFFLLIYSDQCTSQIRFLQKCSFGLKLWVCLLDLVYVRIHKWGKK